MATRNKVLDSWYQGDRLIKIYCTPWNSSHSMWNSFLHSKLRCVLKLIFPSTKWLSIVNNKNQLSLQSQCSRLTLEIQKSLIIVNILPTIRPFVCQYRLVCPDVNLCSHYDPAHCLLDNMKAHQNYNLSCQIHYS